MATDFITKLKSKYDANNIPYEDRGNYIKTQGVPLGQLTSTTNQVANVAPTTNIPTSIVPTSNVPTSSVVPTAQPVSNVYDLQSEAARLRAEGLRNTARSRYERERTAVAPQFYEAGRQVQSQADLARKAQNEALAARGLTEGGAAVESQLRGRASLSGDLARLGREEAQTFADIESRQTESMQLIENNLNASLAEIEAAKTQGIIDEKRYQEQKQRAEMEYADKMQQLALENQRYLQEVELEEKRYQDELLLDKEQEDYEREIYEREFAKRYGDVGSGDILEGATSNTQALNTFDLLRTDITQPQKYATGGRTYIWNNLQDKYDDIVIRHPDVFRAELGNALYSQLVSELQSQVEAPVREAEIQGELIGQQQKNINDTLDFITRNYMTEGFNDLGETTVTPNTASINSYLDTQVASGYLTQESADVIRNQFGIIDPKVQQGGMETQGIVREISVLPANQRLNKIREYYENGTIDETTATALINQFG